MRTNGCRVESSFTALVQRVYYRCTCYITRESREYIRASHMEAWSPSQGRRAGRQLVLLDSVIWAESHSRQHTLHLWPATQVYVPLGTLGTNR